MTTWPGPVRTLVANVVPELDDGCIDLSFAQRAGVVLQDPECREQELSIRGERRLGHASDSNARCSG